MFSQVNPILSGNPRFSKEKLRCHTDVMLFECEYIP